MAANNDISYKDAKSTFSYDPETGKVIRLKSGGHYKVGDVVGGLNKFGYLRTKLNRKHIFVHRLAWLLHYGEYPNGEIDHANGNKTDNRILNLRVVTRSQNQINKPIPKNNTTGIKGVNWNALANKWAARIAVNGKRIHLGYFDKIEQAKSAYLNAANLHHNGFHRLGV